MDSLTLDRIICEEQFGHTSDYLIRRAFGNVYEPLLECKGAQVDRWLKPAVEGVRTCAIAITESGRGFRRGRHQDATPARPRPAGCSTAANISSATVVWSDFFLVSAKTGEKEISHVHGRQGPARLHGRQRPEDDGLARHAAPGTVFRQCGAGDATLLGEQGQGFKLAMGALNVVRLAQVGARAVGKASHVLELMVDYANERKQFGQKIGDFQMVQQMLADSVIEINAARWMVYQAAWMLDQGLDAREQIAMVKVYAAETLGRWWTARCRCSAAWVSARSCRSSAITAMRASTASLTAPARSTAR